MTFFPSYLYNSLNLRGFCELDIERVQEEQVERLISRIENVPRNMTRTFIRMYEDLLEREPPIPASTRAQIEAKLEQLRSFEERLDELEAENEDRNALNGVSSDDITELAQAKLNS